MILSIGKIVSANTHTDYICQVYGRGETDPVPAARDHAYGTFVSIELENSDMDSRLVGVIYNTLLVNPDFGNLGPRLSPREEIEIFSPDYLSETATLVGIVTLGWLESSGTAKQGVPPLAAAVNAPVWTLDEDEVRRFHRDDSGHLSLRYMPFLMQQSNPLLPPLMTNLVDRLAGLFPDQHQRLSVLRNNLAWRQVVQPAG